MYPYFETLCVDDGEPQRIVWHERRMNSVRREVWGQQEPLSLAPAIEALQLGPGRYKVHIGYNADGLDRPVAELYHRRDIRSLRLVTADDIDYSRKATDRSALDRLKAMRGGCDEVIIVKHGLLTDTSYTNIALYDGHRWVTPRQPLLAGTMRAWLIDHGMLAEADIRPEDLYIYNKVSLINAMMGLGEVVVSSFEL